MTTEQPAQPERDPVLDTLDPPIRVSADDRRIVDEFLADFDTEEQR